MQKSCIADIHHYIQTTGPPVAERPRRLSGDKQKADKVEIDFLLEKGICRLSRSPWASPLHIQKTGVCTPFGLIEFLCMPFGLRNPSKIFQRAMDTLFKGMDFGFCYIDDIILMSSSTEQHLRQVLYKLSDHGLTINMNTCHFGVESSRVFRIYN